MSTHKHIDRICVVITVLCLIVTVLFVNGEALGIKSASRAPGYEDTLFDTSRVHTIEIVIDDWDAFLETCESEEYSVCAVVIDNESVKNVAIRGKGNTSLSTVRTLGSERYSFKIEFDHFQSGKSYHGLDKLSLNNIIQDNTYMKDYLSYRLMAAFGVTAPLCSFVYITVNGEDWGLYLAVEGVEDSFLERNYGRDVGELYKPDSMSFGGGGPGNGKDFNMDDFRIDKAAGEDAPEEHGESEAQAESETRDSQRGGFGAFPGGFSFDFGGMGSNDVKLQYSDADPDSYSNIFNNAKTDVSETDQARLIESLKKLNAYEDIESVVDVDEVLRYFVVHNYVCNGDSYTGSIVHNYYLHEQDGQLSMIPWDYNLAFGTFQSSDATDTVNDPIDTPMSVSDADERPMWGWFASSEKYTALYHQYFAEFLDSVDIVGIIDETYALIAGYVAKDPTAFCTCEEFETGVAALRTFCEKRTESIRGQLDGSIPSTDAGQRADSSALIDASELSLSDMGSMGGSGSGGFGGFGGRSGGEADGEGSASAEGSGRPDFGGGGFPGGNGGSGFPDGGSFPGGGDGSSFSMPGGGSFPGGGDGSSFSMPEGGSFPNGGDGGSFSMPGGGSVPGGGDGGSFNMPNGSAGTDGSSVSGNGQSSDGGMTPPSGGSFSPSELAGAVPGESGSSGSASTWLIAGVSAAVLIAALIFALKYRKHG